MSPIVRVQIPSSTVAITSFRELNTFLVCPDEELSLQLQRACSMVPGVRFGHVFDAYPGGDRLCNLLCVKTPDVVIVDVSKFTQAAGVIASVKAELPSAQIIAAHWSCDPEIVLAVMRMGVSDFIYPGIEADSLQDVFIRVRSRVSPAPATTAVSGQVVSLLPARAGVGTTTAAVNIATQCANECDGRVFLGDFDLGCGTLRFMLKLQNPASVLDAAERVLDLDDELWSQIVQPNGKLDVLHSGIPCFLSRLSPASVRQLAAFLRRKYKFTFADLSGQFEDYSIELLQASSRILVVTTPEITSLHQAREKVRILENEGFADRTAVVLTRATRSGVNAQEVEQVVGAPVEATLSEDHHNVQVALTAGRTVAEKSEYAKNCAMFARKLNGSKGEKPARRRKFVEYFCTVPARYRFEHA